MKKREIYHETERQTFTFDELIELMNEAKSKGADTIEIHGGWDGDTTIYFSGEREMTDEEIECYNKHKDQSRSIKMVYYPRHLE